MSIANGKASLLDYDTNRRLTMDGGTQPDDPHVSDTEGEVLLSPNLRSVSQNGELEALLGNREPRDKYNLVYLVFYLLGMGTLLPWNFFISVNSYWDYKFRDVNGTNVSRTIDQSGVFGRLQKPIPEQQTELQKEFTSYLAIASNVPNAVCVILHALVGQSIKLKYRLFASLALIIIFFFIVLAFSKTNSDSWQQEFLELILVLVVLINVCTAVFQGSVFGVGGKFPPKYMAAIMAGQAMGGIFPSVAEIVALALQVQDKDIGFVCFLIATIFLISCFLTFAWVRNVNFFKYYNNHSQRNSSEQSSQSSNQHQHSSILSVIKQSWQYCLSVYIVFGTTLMAFPAVTVLVESQYKSGPNPNVWADKYFTPVTCFLLFNCGDYAGRLLGNYFMKPAGFGDGRNPLLLILAFARLVFVPLFMFCNAAPTQRSLPVIFHNDWFYILLMVLFAVSNGYLGNLGMIQGPKVFASSQDQEQCAMVLVACLVLGTGSGSFLSYPIVSVL